MIRIALMKHVSSIKEFCFRAGTIIGLGISSSRMAKDYFPPEVEINDQGLLQKEELTSVDILIFIRAISIAGLSQSLPRVLVG